MNSHASQTLRAAIYTRVSSDEQTKGYGLEYQLEDCRRAVAQHGHSVFRVYSDPGISGTLEDRPGLNDLRRDAQGKLFDIVYFWKSDRLARDEILQLTLYREFRRLGIETCSVAEPQMNDLMRGIYAVFGAEDLRNIKAKTYSGRLRAIRAGKWIGSTPYGYRKDDNLRLVPNPAEASWVAKLFEWYVDEGLSLYSLTKRANEHQIPTQFDSRRMQKRINGVGYWNVGTISNLLKREYYATGKATFTVRPELGQATGLRSNASATETIIVSIPPLISMDLFERVQRHMRRNSEYSRRSAKHSYLFAKKLRCRNCGLKFLAMFNNHGKKYYRSNYLSRQQRCRCGCYSEEALDRLLWPKLLAFFSKPDEFMAALEDYRTRDSQLPDIKAYVAALKELEDRAAKNERALLACELDGFYTPEVLLQKKRELVALRNDVSDRQVELRRRAGAESQRAKTVASARALYRTLRKKIDAATYATKRHVYERLIEKVILGDNVAEVWLSVPMKDGVMTVETQNAQSPLTSSEFVDYFSIATPSEDLDWPAHFTTGDLSGLLVFSVPYSKARRAV